MDAHLDRQSLARNVHAKHDQPFLLVLARGQRVFRFRRTNVAGGSGRHGRNFGTTRRSARTLDRGTGRGGVLARSLKFGASRIQRGSRGRLRSRSGKNTCIRWRVGVHLLSRHRGALHAGARARGRCLRQGRLWRCRRRRQFDLHDERRPRLRHPRRAAPTCSRGDGSEENDMEGRRNREGGQRSRSRITDPRRGVPESGSNPAGRVRERQYSREGYRVLVRRPSTGSARSRCDPAPGHAHPRAPASATMASPRLTSWDSTSRSGAHCCPGWRIRGRARNRCRRRCSSAAPPTSRSRCAVLP